MSGSNDEVRLFVACEVPDEVREAIASVIAQLRPEGANAVRWIRPEGVHVTLKFLGEVSSKKLPAIKIAIQEAVLRHHPFNLELANIGTFGGREGLRIMWVGVAGDVLRVRAVQVASGIVLLVQLQECAAVEHLVDELAVLLLGAVAPANSVRARQLRRFSDPIIEALKARRHCFSSVRSV